jgi:transmembrane sensor
MTPNEFKALLDKYASGKCSPEELRLLDQWFENIPTADLSSSSIRPETRDRIWKVVMPSPALSDHRWIYRIAATITFLALVLSSYLYIQSTSWQQTPIAGGDKTVVITDGSRHVSNNEKSSQKVTLSDGSTVMLQPGSAITYPEKFEGPDRTVHLSGEAFFDVRRDESRPFIVYSNEIITKVLGTSFTIKAYDSESEIIVAVKTGKVSVSPNPVKQRRNSSMRDVILTPNQQVVYNRDAEVVSREIVPQPAIVAKKDDFFRMQFDGQPVSRIFDLLEENYGIDIQYDAEKLNGCVLTTSMEEEGFYERINVICKAINAQYTTTDAVIIIRSEGCK